MKRQLAITLLATALMAIPGCTLTPEQRDDREYRREYFEAQFIDFRQRCWANGGRILIDAKQSLRKGDIPRRGDRYFCS